MAIRRRLTSGHTEMLHRNSTFLQRLPTVVLLACLPILRAIPVRGADAPRVERAPLERQGGAWVETLQASAPATHSGRLVLRAAAGSIEVVSGDVNQVRCRMVLKAFTPDQGNARALLSAFPLKLSSSGQGIVIVESEFAPSRARKSAVSVEFHVTVPRAFHLNLMTGSGNILVESPIEGSVRAVTAGGNVRVAAASGAVRVETSGGDIQVGDVGGLLNARTAGGSIHAGSVASDALLETSGGDITAGKIGGRATLDTAGGDILLAGAQGAVRAETSGGQIRIGATAANVDAQSAGGSIFLNGSRGVVRVETAGGSINLFDLMGAVNAQTASGSIVAELVQGPHALQASRLVTTNGSVTVYIPSSLALTIHAQVENAAGRSIGSDFPLKIVSPERGFAGQPIRAVGLVNGGGQTLQINSSGGKIQIRLLTPAVATKLRERETQVWNK